MDHWRILACQITVIDVLGLRNTAGRPVSGGRWGQRGGGGGGGGNEDGMTGETKTRDGQKQTTGMLLSFFFLPSSLVEGKKEIKKEGKEKTRSIQYRRKGRAL